MKLVFNQFLHVTSPMPLLKHPPLILLPYSANIHFSNIETHRRTALGAEYL
jgi:hypothetical protein